MNDNPRNPDQWTQPSSPGAEVSPYSHEVQAAKNEAMRQAESIDTSSKGLVDQSSVAQGLAQRAENLARPVGSGGEFAGKTEGEILAIGLLLAKLRKMSDVQRTGARK